MIPPRTLGFHHVTMVSSDVARTLRFYGDLLGLDLVARRVDVAAPGTHRLYLGMAGGRPGTLLEFLEWPQGPRGGAGVGAVHHVALGVRTPHAQLRWKRRLTDAGVAVNGPIDRGYFRSLYFRDPDGQVLEIATAGPGYAIDEPAGELGRALVVPPRERLPEGRDRAAIRASTHPEPVPEITSEMSLMGIHHVSAITHDLARAHDFYTSALGLSLVKRTLNQDDGRTEHWFWARYHGDEVAPLSSFTLFGWPDSTRRGQPGAGQTQRVAFRAGDPDEQATWREHLLSLGLEVPPVLEGEYFHSLHFQAPDGLLLEIATDGPGFRTDEPQNAEAVSRSRSRRDRAVEGASSGRAL